MSPTLPLRTTTSIIPVITPATADPTRTLFPLAARNTLHENTTSTIPCCPSAPTAVVLDIHTRVIIPDYSLFYSAPISSFHPDYHALGDGSLVATPLIADIRNADTHLALTSALAMFFLVTTLLSIQYLRRMKIKKKLLFYILCLSQTLGLVCTLMSIIPFFNEFISCTSAGLVIIISATLSYSLLMTGILGIKAYRCLNNSRLVLAVLAVLRTAMLILMILNLTKYSASRRLSGSCTTSMNLADIPVVIILQSSESAFICLCYIFAVWKHSRSSVEQGRLSINLSVDKPNHPSMGDKDGGDEAQRRGWWDYVPEVPRSERLHVGLARKVGMRLQGLWQTPPSHIPSLQHRPVFPGDRNPFHHARTSVTFSAHRIARSSLGHASIRLGEQTRPQASRDPPPSPSTMSRLSKYMPRMQLLRQVLKNELYYTALVTVIYVVLAIMTLIGMYDTFVMDAMGWIAISWFVVSLFTMHSFSRVVRRHEHEAILQHPSAWDPIYRAELEAARAFKSSSRARPAYSPVSVVSRRPTRRGPIPTDPFEDPRGTSSDRITDRSSVPADGSNEGAGRPPTAQQWSTIPRDFSISPEAASYEETTDNPVHRPYFLSPGREAEMLPSPTFSEYYSPQPASTHQLSPLDLDMEEKFFMQPPMTAPPDVRDRKHRGSKSLFSSRTARRLY